MAPVRTLLGMALLALGACGDALTPEGYRGEELFSVKGQVVQFQNLQPGSAALRIGVFWVPDGRVEAVDLDMLVEQRSASVEVAFPATFDVRIFQPPSPEMLVASGEYGIGLLLVYEDRDGNGRFTPGLTPSELVGGSDDTAVIYAPRALDAARSPTWRALEPGFQRSNVGLLCFGPIDQTCDLPYGAACTDDFDCGFGEGICVTRAAGYTFDGGYCTAPLGGVCDAPSLPRLATESSGLLLAACASDADCRVEEGYACDTASGGCLPAAGPSTDAASNCGIAFGAPCDPSTAASDCGSASAECIMRDSFGSYPDGYCALAFASTCVPADASPYSTQDPESEPTHWFAACESDATCRSGYFCDGVARVCVPDSPASLYIDSAFKDSFGGWCGN